MVDGFHLSHPWEIKVDGSDLLAAEEDEEDAI
jgi:hypothetical protein